MARLRRSSAASIQDFVSQRTLAVVGVSRSGKKFGNAAYRELRAKGYRLFPVNPGAPLIEGDRAYASLAELPEPVGGVFIAVPPPRAEAVVREASAAGITRVWLQQGAESQAALDACDQAGMTVIAGECILMFAAPPTHWIHRAHRFGRQLFGTLPT
jgi:predicted CoA-binding protein